MLNTYPERIMFSGFGILIVLFAIAQTIGFNQIAPKGLVTDFLTQVNTQVTDAQESLGIQVNEQKSFIQYSCKNTCLDFQDQIQKIENSIDGEFQSPIIDDLYQLIKQHKTWPTKLYPPRNQIIGTGKIPWMKTYFSENSKIREKAM